MISFTDQQIIKIKKLRPLTDSKFKYNKSSWTELNEEFKTLICDFEKRDINRQDVIDAYSAYYADNSKGLMKALLLTLVWGFADTGYGAYRTNKYINDLDNIRRIQVALDFIREDQSNSLKSAFYKLNEIKGLGVSYLTKILYFATKAINAEHYALIFDVRVASAFVKLSAPREIFEFVKVRPSYKFTDYQKYNSLMHKLAKDINADADQIEMYLFEQIFD